MKAVDLRTKTPDQLTEELHGLRKEQMNLRFQEATGQLENKARVRQVRRAIARIKTVQSELKQGKAPEAAKPAKKKAAPKKKKETKE